jgi:DNA-binding helix-hairpin-helix protein with protein kinase domain
MQRHWELDELVDHFTLLPPEVQLIREARTAHNRLGFAVLLKCFLLEGRFPSGGVTFSSEVDKMPSISMIRVPS